MLEYTGENVVKLSDMKRYFWITYNWIRVQEYSDTEPKYIIAGLRPIEDRLDAQKQFDAGLVTKGTE